MRSDSHSTYVAPPRPPKTSLWRPHPDFLSHTGKTSAGASSYKSQFGRYVQRWLVRHSSIVSIGPATKKRTGAKQRHAPRNRLTPVEQQSRTRVAEKRRNAVKTPQRPSLFRCLVATQVALASCTPLVRPGGVWLCGFGGLFRVHASGAEARHGEMVAHHPGRS